MRPLDSKDKRIERKGGCSSLCRFEAQSATTKRVFLTALDELLTTAMSLADVKT